MLAMGNLYYYGARGLPRDQPLAFDYFNRAAALGSFEGTVAVANMYLKGEGGPARNLSHAVVLYRQALEADENNVEALNGLGYAYYHGSGDSNCTANSTNSSSDCGSSVVVANKTKALEYFERAAKTDRSSSALFNVGQMYYDGVGTPINRTLSIYYWDRAVSLFGNFGSIYMLGQVYLYGDEDPDGNTSSGYSGTKRDCHQVINTLLSICLLLMIMIMTMTLDL